MTTPETTPETPETAPKAEKPATYFITSAARDPKERGKRQKNRKYLSVVRIGALTIRPGTRVQVSRMFLDKNEVRVRQLEASGIIRVIANGRSVSPEVTEPSDLEPGTTASDGGESTGENSPENPPTDDQPPVDEGDAEGEGGEGTAPAGDQPPSDTPPADEQPPTEPPPALLPEGWDKGTKKELLALMAAHEIPVGEDTRNDTLIGIIRDWESKQTEGA